MLKAKRNYTNDSMVSLYCTEGEPPTGGGGSGTYQEGTYSSDPNAQTFWEALCKFFGINPNPPKQPPHNS